MASCFWFGLLCFTVTWTLGTNEKVWRPNKNIGILYRHNWSDVGRSRNISLRPRAKIFMWNEFDLKTVNVLLKHVLFHKIFCKKARFTLKQKQKTWKSCIRSGYLVRTNGETRCKGGGNTQKSKIKNKQANKKTNKNKNKTKTGYTLNW